MKTYSIYGSNLSPLTYEQELNHLILWKKNKNRRSHEILIHNYILYTVKKVRRMYCKLPQDAVMQIAHRSLLQSIEGFDPTRANVGRLSNLIPWFARVANKEYIKECETVRLPASKIVGIRFVSLDSEDWSGEDQIYPGGPHLNKYDNGMIQEHHLPDSSNENLFNPAESALEENLREEKRVAMIGYLHLLPLKQRRVLEKVYYKNLSFAQIARDNKPPITREAVRQQHTKALHKLRSVVQENGILTG